MAINAVTKVMGCRSPVLHPGGVQVTGSLHPGGVQVTDTAPLEESLRENHNKVLSFHFGVDLELFVTD
jgi:hypothetical protein